MVQRKAWNNTKYARNFPGKSTKYPQSILQTKVTNDHGLDLIYRLNTVYKCVNVEASQRELFQTFTQRDLR